MEAAQARGASPARAEEDVFRDQRSYGIQVAPGLERRSGHDVILAFLDDEQPDHLG